MTDRFLPPGELERIRLRAEALRVAISQGNDDQVRVLAHRVGTDVVTLLGAIEEEGEVDS